MPEPLAMPKLPPLPPLQVPPRGPASEVPQSPAVETRRVTTPPVPPPMDFLPAPALQPLPELQLGQQPPRLDDGNRPFSPGRRMREEVTSDATSYSTATFEDGGPRALTWEEARVAFVPVGTTVRGVVEEVRPYGAFIGFILSPGKQNGEGDGVDSHVRGFCEAAELGPPEVHPEVGEQVAVRIMSVDRSSQRISVSVEQADPRWPSRLLPNLRTAHSRPSDREAEALVDAL